ncbi:MAG: hypothetical protein ACJ716_11005 [Marmoricola sp.]
MTMTIDTASEVADLTETETAQRDRTAFTIWRIFAWSGAVYATLGLIFWAGIAGFLPAPHESLNADGIKDFFLTNETRIRVGMVGYLFIASLYLPWSVVIARIVTRIEGPYGLLGRVEFFGGIATVFTTLFSGVMWLAASFRTADRSSQDIQLLSDVGWFIFDMTFVVTLVQMVALGTAILIDRRSVPYFPKWLGWFCYLMAFTFVPLVVMPFLQTGPFAWHGLFNYWIALGAFFAFIYTMTFYVHQAVKRVEIEELGPRGV